MDAPSREQHGDRVSGKGQDSEIRGWEQMKRKNQEERYNAVGVGAQGQQEGPATRVIQGG